MLDRQRLGLTDDVAALLDEGVPTYWELEHPRLLTALWALEQFVATARRVMDRPEATE